MKRKGIIGALVTSALIAVGVYVGGPDTTGTVYDPGQAYEVDATQQLRYIIQPYAESWGEEAGLLRVEIAELRARLSSHRDVGFVIRPKIRPTWSKAMTLNEAIIRYRTHLLASQTNAIWYIRAIDGYKEKAKKVDLNPAVVMDTAGTMAIDIIIGTTVTKFPDIQGLGICVCKKIEGSNTWSQHSYCNAIDWGAPQGVAWGSPLAVRYLDEVNEYLAELDRAGYLPIAQLGWRNWSGHYPGHIHVSGDPMHAGTPGCA